MVTLDELLDMDGVVVAFEFSLDGELAEYKAKVSMPQDIAELTALFCAAVSSIFNALATTYTRDAPMTWIPQQAWTYSGGGWTVAVGRADGRFRGAFTETGKTDFNALYRAMAGKPSDRQFVPWPWVE